MPCVAWKLATLGVQERLPHYMRAHVLHSSTEPLTSAGLGLLLSSICWTAACPVARLSFRPCKPMQPVSNHNCLTFCLQVIGSQIERQQDDNACLAYWLTNTVILLHLLQRNIKPASGSSTSVKRVAQAAGRSIMGGLFGRQPAAGGLQQQWQLVCGLGLLRQLHPVWT